jgi:DNA-binding HxlR family transcriptional regulator
MKATRSGCPINLSLELFGDRWTLLVLRDIIFTGARHFRELLHGPERISSNILADRLDTLVAHGLLTRADDPSHKQKVIYSLTEQAIELVPVLAQLSAGVFATSLWARSSPPRRGCSPPADRRSGRPSWTSCVKRTSAPTPAANRRQTAQRSPRNWKPPMRLHAIARPAPRRDIWRAG